MGDRRISWFGLLLVAIVAALSVGVLTTMLGSFARQALYPAPDLPVGEPPVGMSEVLLPLSTGDQVVLWASEEIGDDRPLVLFFHGNGENLASLDYGGILNRFHDLGVAVAAIDYPGYGRSTGTPSEAGLKEAGRAAIAWAQRRFPENPLVVAGWSLGAAVAISAVADSARSSMGGAPGPVVGLVAMSPWTSLSDVARRLFPEWLVGMMLDESYDSETSARGIDRPALVIHGEADELIPAEHGRRIVKALQGPTRELFVPAGHNDLLGVPEIWQELRRFIAQVSSPTAPASDD